MMVAVYHYEYQYLHLLTQGSPKAHPCFACRIEWVLVCIALSCCTLHMICGGRKLCGPQAITMTVTKNVDGTDCCCVHESCRSSNHCCCTRYQVPVRFSVYFCTSRLRMYAVVCCGQVSLYGYDYEYVRSASVPGTWCDTYDNVHVYQVLVLFQYSTYKQ